MYQWFLTFYLKETKFKKQKKTRKTIKEKQKRGALIMIMSVREMSFKHVYAYP